jgi:hypothetical protein
MTKPHGKLYPFDKNLLVFTDGTIWNMKKKDLHSVNFDKNGRRKCNANGNNRLVYRIVMLTHNFRRDHENLEVHHADGDKSNDNLSNLYWMTRQSHNQVHRGMKKREYHAST